MSEPTRDPAIRIPGRRVLVLAAFAIIVFWFARPVMLPFAVAAIIAYAFSPYIDRVQARTHRSRLLIVVLCYGTALLAIVALVIAFANPVYHEIVLLARAGPDALETALQQVLGTQGVVIGDQHFTIEAARGPARGRSAHLPPDARGRDPRRRAAAPRHPGRRARWSS